MTPLSIIGLFCEDIREESGEVLTLVGLLPDNINARKPQNISGGAINAPFSQSKFLNKLCVYVRANFDPDDPIRAIKLAIVFPDGQEVSLGETPPETMVKAKADAKAKSLPLAGIIMRAAMGGFKLQKDGGLIRLEATIDEEKRLLAALNFVVKEETTSSNTNSPPS